MRSYFAKLKMLTIHQIKEYIILSKYYQFKRKKETKSIIVAVFDNRRKAMGLVDRLKGIISLYAFSKIHDITFKCDFNFPFNLENYLIPNEYNWLFGLNEKSTSQLNTRVLILHGEDGQRLANYRQKKQTHVYINRDYLDILNEKFNKQYVWGELFNELFKPAPTLEAKLNYFSKEIGAEYIACQLRFMSLLGDFNEYNQKPLPAHLQDELIDKCADKVLELKSKCAHPLLIVSDSVRFVEHMTKFDGIVGFPEKIVHIDCVENAEEDVFMKPFIDFFMLSKATKVFSIVSNEMYESHFPLYAAKLNNVPFERIYIS